MSSILFVSQDADLRAVARRVLERAGCHVSTAAHGGHALLACAGGRPIDVLVIEQDMPEGAGQAIAARLRRYHPGLAVIRLCHAGASARRGGDAVARPVPAAGPP